MSKENFTSIWFKFRLFPSFAKIQDGDFNGAVNRLELVLVNQCQNLWNDQAFHRKIAIEKIELTTFSNKL